MALIVPAGGTMVTAVESRLTAAARLLTLVTLRVRDREADLRRGIETTLSRLQVAGRAATLGDPPSA